MTTDAALWGALRRTPTGNNLLLGTFVAPVTAVEPSTQLNRPADGTVEIYSDGANVWLYCFTRATGWMKVALTPA